MDPIQADAIHNERHVKVICVGAGASGLCLAYKLQRSFQNYDLTVCFVFSLAVLDLGANCDGRFTKRTQRSPVRGTKTATRAAPAMSPPITTSTRSSPNQTGLPYMLVQARLGDTSMILSTSTGCANTFSHLMWSAKPNGSRNPVAGK